MPEGVHDVEHTSTSWYPLIFWLHVVGTLVADGRVLGLLLPVHAHPPGEAE